MAQVYLVDSERLSDLLQEAISWSDHVSSLMVAATNGSILACAFKGHTPKIRKMRSMSSTFAAALAVAADDTLTFEAQNMGSISVITPIGDHTLLAATGPQPTRADPATRPAVLEDEDIQHEHEGERSMNGDNGSVQDQHQDETIQIRADLELVSRELASQLKDHLSGLKWPEDV